MASQHTATPERIVIFSDGVFAIVITILVLDLRPPASADWAGFLSLWPKAFSYSASYLFLAIVWLNHHHLMRYVRLATPRLLWGNFGHLFSVSLVPFATAWIAETRLAAVPVAVYAAIFMLVNVTYLVLCWEGVDRGAGELSPRSRRLMRMRSFGTLIVFALAALVALKVPLMGMALICACLLLYLRPEAPGQES
jgi:uncharacterized membrane protein